MKSLWVRSLAAACLTAALALPSTPASAQSAEKEKPRLYTYVANWQLPRAKWDDMEKLRGVDKTLDQAVSSGTILGYGSGTTLIHQVDGATHDSWWVGNSEAALFNVLDQITKAGGSKSPVLDSATKHWDNLYVSRFYGWHAGTIKGGYVHGSSYKLKPDAPNDAVEVLSKGLIAPLFEKLTADGSVTAWQVATEAIHTEDPNLFFIFYITSTAEGMDKVNAALSEATKANSFALPAFGSMVDFTPHRDFVGREEAVLK
jgi:hypothetical protein